MLRRKSANNLGPAEEGLMVSTSKCGGAGVLPIKCKSVNIYVRCKDEKVPILRPVDEGAKDSISKALRRKSANTLGLQMKVKKCQYQRCWDKEVSLHQRY